LLGACLQWFLRRRFNRDNELDAEHPIWIAADYPRSAQLQDLAVRVAAEIPDDAEAVAAIRASADGRRKDWKAAAAWMRSSSYTWEHRNDLRAARLLKAAADGGSPVPPSADQEAMFRAVERLEAVPFAEAFAMLASEAPALMTLEHQVVSSLSEPGWADRGADDRVHEIVDELAQLVGPRASGGSPLIQSETAFRIARVHLVGKARLLIDDEDVGPDAGLSASGTE